MSIGLAIPLGRWMPKSARPLDVVRSAARFCEDQGWRVGAPEMAGVEYRHYQEEWGVRRDRQPPVVSLAGAVCLFFQPRAPSDGLHANATTSAASALGVSADWMEGLLDGMEGAVSAAKVSNGNRDEYLAGHRVGAVLWVELTLECEKCGRRRSRLDPTCVPCGC